METSILNQKPVAAEQTPSRNAALKLSFCTWDHFSINALMRHSKCKSPQLKVHNCPELDYIGYLDKASQEKDSHEAQRVRCDKCGAETTVPPDSAADDLPILRRDYGFSDQCFPLNSSPRESFPSRYRKVKLAGFSALDSKASGSPGRPEAILPGLRRSLAGVYIPFWTYDSNTQARITTESARLLLYGRDLTRETENGRSVTRTREVRHTRWTPSSGMWMNSFERYS